MKKWIIIAFVVALVAYYKGWFKTGAKTGTANMDAANYGIWENNEERKYAGNLHLACLYGWKGEIVSIFEKVKTNADFEALYNRYTESYNDFDYAMSFYLTHWEILDKVNDILAENNVNHKFYKATN